MCGAEQQLPYCLELPTLPKKCLMVDEDDPEMSDHQETLDAKVSVRHQCPSCPVSVVSSVHRAQCPSCPVSIMSSVHHVQCPSCPVYIMFSVRHVQCPSCPVSVMSSVHRVQSVGQRASRLCGDRVQAASSSQLST